MKFIPRKVYLQVEEHLSKPEISLILGPRQAGKTTIMLKLAEELENEGKPNLYFNLDVIEDKLYFKTQHNLIGRIESVVGSKPAVVFIDEIHRLENAGLFLKGLFDLKTSHKFVVSGSGSLELKADIIEPMTGRKRIFYCLPLSFTEFAAYKLDTTFERVSSALDGNPHERKRLLNEYFIYGGYPRAVLSQTYKEKAEVLSEIYRSYLERDIQLLLKVEKSEAFRALVKLLAAQTGNIVNRSELASTLGISEKTVRKYLFLLEKTFVIALVKPFSTNVRREVRKLPKVYFLDLGFLNLARGFFPKLGGIEGGVFENACFLRLQELDLLEPIRFWRSLSGAEVDFVAVSPRTGKPLPIEAKLSPGRKGTLGKSLISFIKRYKPRKVYVYNKDTASSGERFGAKIHLLPFHFLPEI